MTAPISSIDMYNILRAKIGEQEAKALTDYVKSEVESRVEIRSATLATKDDIASLRKEISDSKVDMIKWMVGLFITLALMIIGLYVRK